MLRASEEHRPKWFLEYLFELNRKTLLWKALALELCFEVLKKITGLSCIHEVNIKQYSNSKKIDEPGLIKHFHGTDPPNCVLLEMCYASIFIINF